MRLSLKQVPKTYKPKRACVYSITHPEYLGSFKGYQGLVWKIWGPCREVYVGVTTDVIGQRWRDHKALRARDNQTTSRFIRDNNYDFEDCFRIIFEGTEDQCYRLEYHLRSAPDMGLNRKTGGKLKHRKTNKRYLDMIEEALC